MSLYAKYLLERTDVEILERDDGFATYRFMNDGKSVYLIDIFVPKDLRNQGIAAEMADLIAKKAKSEGCTEMIGSVKPSTNGSTESLKVLLAYGFKLLSSGDDFIFFRKDL